MEFRRLPGTDLNLSVVGLGCWAIGGLWWGDDVRDEDSKVAIEAALDAGINWLDTAPLYGHGRADRLIRETLGARRHDVVIATKVGVRWRGQDGHARSDLSARHIARDIDDSLARLGVDHIDLLQVHWPCQEGTPLEETVGALMAAQEAGKVRHVGLCNYGADGIVQARSLGRIVSLQTPYSMLRREFEGELRRACVAEGGEGGQGEALGVLAYEPLCRGLLAARYGPRHRFPDSDLRARDDRFQGPAWLRALTIARRLDLLAQRHGTTAAALAIAWVCRQPGVTAAVVGAKRAAQVRANAAAAALIADEALAGQVDAIAAAWRG